MYLQIIQPQLSFQAAQHIQIAASKLQMRRNAVTKPPKRSGIKEMAVAGIGRTDHRNGSQAITAQGMYAEAPMGRIRVQSRSVIGGVYVPAHRLPQSQSITASVTCPHSLLLELSKRLPYTGCSSTSHAWPSTLAVDTKMKTCTDSVLGIFIA